MDTMQEWTVDDLPKLNGMIMEHRKALESLEQIRDSLEIQACDTRLKAINPDWYFGMELALVPDALSYLGIKDHSTVYLIGTNYDSLRVGDRVSWKSAFWLMDTDTVARMRAAWVAIKKEAQP